MSFSRYINLHLIINHLINFIQKCHVNVFVCDCFSKINRMHQRNSNSNNKEKEIVILRSKGNVLRAAVKTDFPCCLIEKDEILKIQFINNNGNASTEQKPTIDDTSKPETLVTFYIHTTGGQKKKLLMKNRNLRLKVEDVCVYAFKEEDCITALKRDGRFIDYIFQKYCALSEMDSETIYEMSIPAEHLHQKHFQVIVISDIDLPDSQNALGITKTESDSTLELRTKPKVQNFFREEYDKSVQSFSKVRKVKEIMRLSESVCQIRVEGSAPVKATGFLLFGKFILTNAHVIKNFDPFTWKIHDPIKAAFGFEQKSDKGNVTVVSVKDTFAARHQGTEEGNHFDFALLELNGEIPETFPRLLKSYAKDNCTATGEVCIVGHPNSEVKKIDPCFIIGRGKRQKVEIEHVSENIKFYHIMTQQSMKEKWSFSKNQMTYNSCFFHGSSGSPVFDRKCRLIGIHTGGFAYRGEGKIRSVMEYAYAMQPILDKIKTLAEDKNRTDILEYLNDTNNYLNMTQKDQEMADVSGSQIEL
uniref:Serine protease n=1 Tax=Sinocyclocheilus grahami TaxID=75366 RepID=A0A672M090_SINGR